MKLGSNNFLTLFINDKKKLKTIKYDTLGDGTIKDINNNTSDDVLKAK